MKRRDCALSGSLATATLLISAAASAETITVNGNSGPIRIRSSNTQLVGTNGATIRCGSVKSGNGIMASGVNNIEIRNIKVTNCFRGIYLSRVSGATIDRVFLKDNGNPNATGAGARGTGNNLLTDASTRVTVTNTISIGSKQHGIYFGQNGASPSDGGHHVVRNCILRDNWRNGIQVNANGSSFGNVFEGNLFINNGGGLNLMGFRSSLVVNNVFVTQARPTGSPLGSRPTGIAFYISNWGDAALDNQVFFNTFYFNQGRGIFVTNRGGSGNIASSNLIVKPQGTPLCTADSGPASYCPAQAGDRSNLVLSDANQAGFTRQGGDPYRLEYYRLLASSPAAAGAASVSCLAAPEACTRDAGGTAVGSRQSIGAWEQ